MPAITRKKTTAVLVRSLPVEIHQQLKRRAKDHGVSTEAEIRSILKNAVQPEEKLNAAELLIAFGKKYGPLPYKRDLTPAQPMKFE